MIARQELASKVEEALREFGCQESDREIARRIGVSNRTVSLARKRLEDAGDIPLRGTHLIQACLGKLCTLKPEAIRPCPNNDDLYDPINKHDPSFLALVQDIGENGILEPIVISQDGVILSGHRRLAAAQHLGLETVPVRIQKDVSYQDDPEQFFALLASYNRQRVKTTAEQVREELALSTDNGTYSVRAQRVEKSRVDADGRVVLGRRRKRSKIRDKLEFRAAILKILEDERRNLPLSDRSIHYRLVNVVGLVRNDKSREPYLLDGPSYKDLTNMLTRMRFDGSIPFESISDETRGVTEWRTFRSVGSYVRTEVNDFLRSYHRDLQQSQPNWVELLVEKNTVAMHLRELAGYYTIPMTSGRGYSSAPPRYNMVQRFRNSGRQKLVVIVVSDHDPEGNDIPRSFGESLRDDCGVASHELEIFKATLTMDQIVRLELPEGQIAKVTGSRYKKYSAAFGNRSWELEAMTVEQLQDLVRAAIHGVLDLEAFDAELAREKLEDEQLAMLRGQLKRVLLGRIRDIE